jgi:hypothetical protein
MFMMLSPKVSGAVFAVAVLGSLAGRPAHAQMPTEPGPAGDYYASPPPSGPAEAAPQQETPIPPYVEGQPIPVAGGGYCYVGPHPVDTRAQPGPSFDDAQGQHIHYYPPVDLRLFSYRDGCYYFIGDPRDFGYTGRAYSYYGAHPVLDAYGGGWCFMMGGHYHMWAPWSPYFTVVGPWYYWYGPYDPFFWSYWPYYSFYYRSFYPSYYAGGRFYRGGGFRAAPPISRVPATAWRGGPPGGAGGGWHGAPPSGGAAGGGWHGTPPAAARAAAPGAAANAWRGNSTVPSYSAPMRSAPSYSAPRPGGGFSAPRIGGGGGFHIHHR